MRHVFQAMGMPVSIDVPECDDIHLLQAVETIFHSCDTRFSTYIADSEVMRIQKGTLDIASASIDTQRVWALCEYYTAQTTGYFSHYYNGAFDPTGLTKAYALQLATEMLEHLGFTAFCVNAGGDIVCRSDADSWQLGIQHPDDPAAIMATVGMYNGALVTSGTYARGDHIVDPVRGTASDCLSVTILGPDIITADVYATAVFAMGSVRGLEFIGQQEGYEALCVDRDYRPHTTRLFTVSA